VQARVGAEAQQPTFTFSSKQRPACVRQVSWLSGHRGRPGLPRFPGGRRSERPSPITVAGPRGILTRFPILSAQAEHLTPAATQCATTVRERYQFPGLRVKQRWSWAGLWPAQSLDRAVCCGFTANADARSQASGRSNRHSHPKNALPNQSRPERCSFPDGGWTGGLGRPGSGPFKPRYGVKGQFAQVENPPSTAITWPVT
jgi:hypothetical protein